MQKFKLNIANTVITQENASLLSMNTSDILDLFQLGEKGAIGDSIPSSKKGSLEVHKAKEGGGTLKTILDGIPELWTEEEYQGEYDMNRFMQSLTTTKKE